MGFSTIFIKNWFSKVNYTKRILEKLKQGFYYFCIANNLTYMRLIILTFAVSVLFACNQTDTKATKSILTESNAIADSANFTAIQWLDSMNQNIGKVKKGQVVEIAWRFKNIGKKPLVIQDVRPGCGCTVAEKPEEPIAAGEEGIIKGKFDSNNQNEGEHDKMISVLANTVNSTYHQLSFRVEVVK
jgi:hypothetical protein